MNPSIISQLSSYDDYLILKNFSVATRKMYLRTLKRYLGFHNTRLKGEDINEESTKQFILYRKKSGSSWSTINCDYSALRKYFREVIPGFLLNCLLK